MKVNKNKEYAVNIYLPNAEYWDAQYIKGCIVSKVQTLGSLILAAHAQLPRRVNTRLHTAEMFYFQVCDIETSAIGRYVFRNGKAKKIA